MTSCVQTSAPCELLPWDSDFFHCRIGRVFGNTLNEEQAEGVEEWSEAEAIDALYFLARPDCPRTARTADRHGFRLVDLRATYERRLQKSDGATPLHPKGDAVMRPFEPADVSALQAIAHEAHGDSRFFSDFHFPRPLAEELYSTWIALECQGRAQQVLVAARPGNAPLGYVSCHLDLAERTGQIGLVGVGQEARGSGLGTGLVLAALDWLARQGAEGVTVVTQGKNAAAQRLYQRCGFRTRQVQIWYHKWYSTPLRDDA